MAEVNLSDLFTAISQAMLDAHQAVNRSMLDQYWDYFRPSRLPRDGRMASAGETEDALGSGHPENRHSHAGRKWRVL